MSGFAWIDRGVYKERLDLRPDIIRKIESDLGVVYSVEVELE